MLMSVSIAAMPNRGGMKLSAGTARRLDVGYRDRDQIRVFDRRERRSPRKRSKSPLRRRSRSPRKSRSKSRSRSRSKSPQHSRYSRFVRYNVQVPKYTMDLWVCHKGSISSVCLYKRKNKVDKTVYKSEIYCRFIFILRMPLSLYFLSQAIWQILSIKRLQCFGY